MSDREKSSWIALILYVGIYGYYAWRVWGFIEAGDLDIYSSGELLVWLIVLLVVAQSILHAVVAAARPKEAFARADERERAIHFKATNVGYGVAMLGAAGVTVAIALGQPAFYTANALFFVLVLGETSRNAAQIFLYRRGT